MRLVAALLFAVAAAGTVFGACGLPRAGTAEPTGGSAGATTGTTTVAGGAGGGMLFGGGGATATGSPSGGAGGGQGGGPTESCLNGQDDDGNELTDCEDPACATGYVCVPEAALAERYFTAPGGACEPPFETQIYYRCGGCSCGDGTGSCHVSVRLNKQANCSGNWSAQTWEVVPGAACSNTDKFDAAPGKSVGVEATLVAGDVDCSPEEPNAPATSVEGCSLPSAGEGCEPGSVCVPVSTAPWCVVVAGGTSCPSGYDEGAAQRVLEAEPDLDCDCDCTVGDVTCAADATVTVATNDQCDGDAQEITVDGTCHDSSNKSVSSMVVTGSPIAATAQCQNASTIEGGVAKRICCAP